MGVAFVFPGQGSQIVGMGEKLAENFPSARAVFEEVDDALGEKLSKIIFQGPEDLLTLTANTQPALMAVSMALLRVMEEQGFVLKNKVNFLAGHSLGEYCALCAGGSFSIRDTARLLRIRGAAMQSAVPVGKGAMAALIGLEEEVVEQICLEASKEGVCQIANDNGAGQIVISGEKNAVEWSAKAASDKGAKRSVILPVSAPFHSVLMQPAAKAMEEAFEQVEKKDSMVDIIPNVSVTPEKEIKKLVPLLVEQVTGRVRWRETVEWFAKNDIKHIYEIGSGKVLTGLIRRIDKSINTKNINDIETMEAALQEL